MSAEECQGYACPPSTTVDLPECPGGWEIGNGTAVCATQQPTSQQLAVTGSDAAVGLALVGIALALVALGLNLSYWSHRRQQRRIHQEAEAARQDALAEVDRIIAAGAAATAAKLDHDLEAERAAHLARAGFVQKSDGSWVRVPTR